MIKVAVMLSWLVATTGIILSAQSDSLNVDLEEIIIQGNRLSLPFSESSRTINVITRAEIEAAPVASITELLRYVQGIDIRQRGAHGVQADISIRGGTFDQTLVLVNGIKMSDPQTGHHSLNLPVDIENIERIEVIKGPAARIFGQNAFTGAVNIITKTPEQQFVQLNLQAGQYNLGGVSINAAFPSKQINQYFSFSKDFSEGYRYNTDYNIDNYFYQADLKLAGQQLNILAGYTERAFGANGFYASPDFADQYEAIQTSLAAVEYKITKNSFVITPRIYWRRNQDEYIFVRSNPSIYRNLHIGNTLGMEVNTAWSNKWGATGFGLDVNRVSLRSNNLGDRSRNVMSFFAEHRFRLFDQLDITPGILFNYFSDFDANFLPGIDIGFQITDNFKLYGNAGYTYRVPTFTDLYYEDRANIGNANLQPESALTYELGVSFKQQDLSVQLSAFSRLGTDLIDWTKAIDTLPWQPQNFSNVNMRGAEMMIQWQPTAMQWLRNLNVGYTYIDAVVVASDVAFSRYALENLNHQLVISFDHQVFKQLFHSFRFRYLDRVNLDDYAIIDSRLAWRAKQYSIFLDAANLLDTNYTETNLVPMPGRWIRLGASVKFLE